MNAAEFESKINASPELTGLKPSLKAKVLERLLEMQSYVEAVANSDLNEWKSNRKTVRKITRDRLIEKLDYDETSGNFVWKSTHRKGRVAGHLATERGKTYLRIRIDDELIMAHALVWLFKTGEFPLFEIDHKNGIGTDNRFENLRRSNRLLNNSNTRKRKDGKEHRNITSNGKNFQVTVKYARAITTVTGFETVEQASAARDLLESVIPRFESHAI